MQLSIWRLADCFPTISTIGVWLLFAMTPVRLSAEIVVDDFVDTLRIDLPDDELQRFITPGVGDLAAIRTLSAGGFQADPVGSIDINLTQSSALSVGIPTATATSAHPTIWLSFEYELATPGGGVDLSEGGLNDAIVLDFDRLSIGGSLADSRLYVLAMRGVQIGPILTSASYVSEIRPIPQQSDHSELFFPFASFEAARGPVVSDFDFTSIQALFLYIEFTLSDADLTDGLDLRTTLTEIRSAQMVPEPASFLNSVTLCGWIYVVGTRRFACRSRS